MKIQNYHIEYADPVRHLEDINSIRNTVFTQTLQLDTSYGDDNASWHAIARSEDGDAIGTGRLTQAGIIDGLAVLEPWRKQGVGSALMNWLFNEARHRGLTDLSVNAPLTSAGFFQKTGFVVNYDHQLNENLNLPMTLKLLAKPPRRNSGTTGSQTAQTTGLETLPDTVDASLQLIRHARRKLCLLTPDLEAGLYGQKAVVEALKEYATGNRENLIQIILLNPLMVNGQGHGLVELAQKLPSKFIFRQTVEAEDQQYPSAFMANDRGGYLFRLDSSRYRGRWSDYAPARNRQLCEEFDRIWQRCQPCLEFRVLSL